MKDPVAEQATALAFRGELGAAEQLLTGTTQRQRWVRAYLDAARGRFISSLALSRSLTHAKDPALRAAANRTAASVLRQCGRHREARAYDEQALREAGADAERAHALIGLAADAVGVGAHGRCARALADAASCAPSEWRVLVRLDWVRTELALLNDDPAWAQVAATNALRRARRAGARRHVAKSLLFLGASQAEAGNPAATSNLVRAARVANELGALPIARAASVVIGKGVSGRSIG